MKNRKANNLFEYIMIFAFVGIVVGATLAMISPQIFKDLVKATFETTSNSEQDNVITVGPISD